MSSVAAEQKSNFMLISVHEMSFFFFKQNLFLSLGNPIKELRIIATFLSEAHSWGSLGQECVQGSGELDRTCLAWPSLQFVLQAGTPCIWGWCCNGQSLWKGKNILTYLRRELSTLEGEGDCLQYQKQRKQKRTCTH